MILRLELRVRETRLRYAPGLRPSHFRNARTIWLWSQNPAVAATSAAGRAVSLSRFAASSTRRRVTVSPIPSPTILRYASASQPACIPSSRASSVVVGGTSDVSRRVTWSNHGGRRIGRAWEAKLKKCLVTRASSASVAWDVPQIAASDRADTATGPPNQHRTGSAGNGTGKASQSGSNSIWICSKPRSPIKLACASPAR